MLSNIYNRFRRITTNQLYFPEIDGIRFLAIVLVILFHIHGYFTVKAGNTFTDAPPAYPMLTTFLSNGDRGVQLFFVLSGFVLCLPFAHHYINNGKKVQLKKYFLRRLTRLEPPYLIAITAILFMQLGMHVHPATQLLQGWGASMLYLHDIIYHRSPILTVVAWSLEVEIQFYLIAPLLFSLLSLSRLSRRLILLALIIALIVLQELYPPTFLSIYGYGQYFLAGILLADLYVSDAASGIIAQKWIAIPALACLVAIMFVPLNDVSRAAQFYARLAMPFLVLGFFFMVLKNSIVKKVFSYKFVPIIGGMCYSIYLVHYTIIAALGRFTMAVRVTGYYLPNLLVQLILLFIPILLVSSLYYYYIERPFMSGKWMDMLTRKNNSNE